MKDVRGGQVLTANDFCVNLSDRSENEIQVRNDKDNKVVPLYAKSGLGNTAMKMAA